MKTLRYPLAGLLTILSVVLRIVASSLWIAAFVLLALSSPFAALTAYFWKTRSRRAVTY